METTILTHCVKGHTKQTGDSKSWTNLCSFSNIIYSGRSKLLFYYNSTQTTYCSDLPVSLCLELCYRVESDQLVTLLLFNIMCAESTSRNLAQLLQRISSLFLHFSAGATGATGNCAKVGQMASVTVQVREIRAFAGCNRSKNKSGLEIYFLQKYKIKSQRAGVSIPAV